MWHHAVLAHRYGGYHAGYSHAAGYGHAGSWLGHTIVSAIIHGLIYGAIFHLMRGMGIGEVLLVAVAGVAVVGLGYWWWSGRR
ncbi:MAG: hypothetical protein ACYDCX_10135 [Acidithiobacillus sp.]